MLLFVVERQSVNLAKTLEVSQSLIQLLFQSHLWAVTRGTQHIQATKKGTVLIVSFDESISPMSASEDDFGQHFFFFLFSLFMFLSERIKQQQMRLNREIQCAKEFVDPNNNVPDGVISHMEVSIEPYNAKFWDLTMFVMIMVATAVVGLGETKKKKKKGAYYSSDKERNKYFSILRGQNIALHYFRDRQEVQEIDVAMAWSFVIVASIGLLTMFYFVQYLFKIILLFFMITSINGLTTIGSHVIEYFYPSLLLRPSVFRGHCLGDEINMKWSDVIALIPALYISIQWYLFRFESWAWILQNCLVFFCLGLMSDTGYIQVIETNIPKTLQLPNLKIASILLGTAFFYDIFWVFISPFFFSKSVMVTVATYTHENVHDTLPVMLKFPKINDPLHGPMILGLGDIALPGLFISFLLRFDYLNRSVGFSSDKGYFLPSLIGYAVGLLLTDINMIVMQQGQVGLFLLTISD
ncbi:hypothetical protein RFI_26237 [Reticulomyxa filosa]|uniref:Signal peptide peptidase n=1 Tax=Reticulomyxa filosa TaxID=46433 RepID=X6MAU7_RETFI|nr:hypothetical protein RFI_26237 [Reticulomyxa filosa]|eukprot:ETO11138.1 hypothetical protein RFI_26237 [Reticulomyxa filosa]